MEQLPQIIAAGALLAVFYLYVALAYVLINFWPVVLFFAFGLTVFLFAIRGARNRNTS